MNLCSLSISVNILYVNVNSEEECGFGGPFLMAQNSRNVVGHFQHLIQFSWPNYNQDFGGQKKNKTS